MLLFYILTMLHVVIWFVSMFGGFISEKFNKFNLLIVLPSIYLIQIIFPVHLISGAKYHYVNSHLEEFASREEITKCEMDDVNDDENFESYSFDTKYDKSIPTDISLKRRDLIYKKTWGEVFNIMNLFNPFKNISNDNNYGITEESLKNINKSNIINKLDNKSKKKNFKSWQNPVSAQGLVIICFIINILIMKFYWKKECLKF